MADPRGEICGAILGRRDNRYSWALDGAEAVRGVRPAVRRRKQGRSRGNIGTDAVAKAAPDGYTFVVGTPGPHVINQFLYKNQPFDSVKDLAPVIVIARVPNIITVSPDVQAKTFKELIDLVKGQPGKLSYATAGIGGTGHVAMELLKSMTGMDILHVPYRGSAPALTDVVAGRVEVSSDNLPAVQPFVEAGKLRALAVTTTKRWPELPDVPTVAEAGVPGYEASAWFIVRARSVVLLIRDRAIHRCELP